MNNKQNVKVLSACVVWDKVNERYMCVTSNIGSINDSELSERLIGIICEYNRGEVMDTKPIEKQIEKIIIRERQEQSLLWIMVMGISLIVSILFNVFQ